MGNLFKNIEATKITTDWYMWIHYMVNDIPNENEKKIFLAKRALRKSNWH